MITRYTLPEMGKLWSIENEWQTILDVEISISNEFTKSNPSRTTT